ncbi:hypothetical protein, partial [uncultured Duncaniella sp.]|uniref:hypothetical protein n=1 Tax=uncultured Duncaniella sp. TaxID=2768039 RepID=UPI00272BAE38
MMLLINEAGSGFIVAQKSRISHSDCKITKKSAKPLQKSKNILTFAPQTDGVLAHLARARHWQCRGE